MTDKKIPFLYTIYHLRSIEHAIIYDKKLDISKEEEKEVIELLKDEYEKEKLNYPFQAPVFDEVAALWGSKQGEESTIIMDDIAVWISKKKL
ncbi:MULTISPECIES: hypothetical protein [Flavobacterium]|uniref:MoxR-vWA-beta-propeller ternary system domain-containing protein n=1 Tax=Flavobacterium jumunjinense TaxID=998845 RepID=A0ABV5GS04_9FLAO|nr:MULTISPECIES: hypothetical protein [Flavobacterium]